MNTTLPTHKLGDRPHSPSPSSRIGSGASIAQTTSAQVRNKKLAKKAAQAPKKGLNDNGANGPIIQEAKRSTDHITYDIEELLDWLEIHMRGPHMNALEN
jgi:hypothetical protein